MGEQVIQFTANGANGYHKNSKRCDSINGNNNYLIKNGRQSYVFAEDKKQIKCHEKTSEAANNSAPLSITICFYLCFATLIIFAYLREFLRSVGIEKNKAAVEANRSGYVPLFKNWANFFNINIFLRLRDILAQPVCSVPGGVIRVAERQSDDYNWTFRNTGKIYEAINLGSYNYLGFAQNTGIITDSVYNTICKYSIGVATTHHELGVLDMHIKLEKLFAKFLNVEACVIFGMGFATNSTNIPTLAGKRCLIIGDQHNHASLKLGSIVSGAVYRAFRHNDMIDLETKLRDAIVVGEPRTRMPWKKIIVIVEGVYSMEGTIANLPELIRLKKKYKCYLYVDEAHSIGAIGPNGKGICDYYNCDPNDVDLLMGTLTKSFGASGGYIAGNANVIQYIRTFTHSSYATSMSPPVVQQITSVLKVLMGEKGGCDGRLRVETLARNTAYFRSRLKQLGFIVNGHCDSPVVPIMIYFPAKMTAFVRLGVPRGIATVGAGYPATSLSTCRIRFCMSAALNQQMLDKALQVISDIGDMLAIKYDDTKSHKNCIDYIIY